jgi:hypothetical protein
VQQIKTLSHGDSGFWNEELHMLHKCVNPECAKLFRSMSAGKLFQVESERCDTRTLSPQPPRASRDRPRVEYFWLCDECSVQWTLTFVKGEGMRTARRAAAAAQGGKAAEVDSGQACGLGTAH